MTNCTFCGEPTSNPKLCSQSCAGKLQRDRRKGSQLKPRHPCLTCQGSTLTKFCSRSCAATYNNKHYPKRIAKLSTKRDPKSEYIQAWLAGEESGCGTNGEMKLWVRRWVFALHGHQCWKCGWSVSRLDGSIPVQIDHIDGHYDNNRPENLRVLCPNCHSLTDTWGGYNKGNGRKYRYASVV